MTKRKQQQQLFSGVNKDKGCQKVACRGCCLFALIEPDLSLAPQLERSTRRRKTPKEESARPFGPLHHSRFAPNAAGISRANTERAVSPRVIAADALLMESRSRRMHSRWWRNVDACFVEGENGMPARSAPGIIER
jgi:hypothetical protein